MSSPLLFVLETVLMELGPAASLIGASGSALNRRVTGASIWLPGDELPEPDIALICPLRDLTDNIDTFRAALHGAQPRTVVLTAAAAAPYTEELVGHSRRHAIVIIEATVNPADVIAAIARMSRGADESVSLRLASVQRSFSQALADNAPVESVMAKLRRAANATVALLGRHGDAIHATGPLPLSLLFSEVTKTVAESQILDVDGWHGVATQISDVDSTEDEHLGWLVAATQRPTFPESYAVSAVHIAASLIETSQRITTIARTQERAIGASVFEQALAIRPTLHDLETEGRLAGLGFAFDQELRATAVRPVRNMPRVREAEFLDQLGITLAGVFKAAGVPVLITVRDQSVALLAQGSAKVVRDLVQRTKGELGAVDVGIGRTISLVGGVSDSYHDAQLAVRTLRRNASRGSVMTYENFDFAMSLFSDVGLDKMADRAERYLDPLLGREALVEGLQTYFDFGQNIIAAASHLNIHHNSLRYRLSKVEELLEIDLKKPATISSLFLALVALDLSGRLRTRPEPIRARGQVSSRPGDVEAPSAATEFVAGAPGLGVVLGGDH